jgi:ribosomal-protein-serine acetyltransferase
MVPADLATSVYVPSIVLRAPVPDDAPALATAVRESVHDLAPWMGWVTPDFDEDQARSWIEGVEGAGADHAGAAFLIVDSTNRVLGACGINQVNLANRFANLGYWVRSSDSGRGIAGTAVRRLAEWVFAHTELQRLELVVAIGNTRSERVAEKAGGLREGVLRSRLLVHGVFHDATMYSIVRDTETTRR